MHIAGQQKMTLIDFPNTIATTVFTAGCNFRCPFCHNPELVLNKKKSILGENDETEKDFFEFLIKRKGKIEGVCITGGEPTLQSDLFEFIKKIKDLGFLVKLDTNGTQPKVIEKLLNLKLLDFIAMDIKNVPEKYNQTTNTKVNIEQIKRSVELIRNSGILYEFRTTVVPGMHEEKDFLAIANWISGARAYYLQEYREAKILDNNLKKKIKGKKIDLKKIKSLIEKNFDKMGIRN